jgi:hypothetical protein
VSKKKKFLFPPDGALLEVVPNRDVCVVIRFLAAADTLGPCWCSFVFSLIRFLAAADTLGLCLCLFFCFLS